MLKPVVMPSLMALTFVLCAPPLSSLRAAVPEGGKKQAPKAPKSDGDDANRSELKAAQEKVRKAVERTIGPRESNFYVVAVSKTSYHSSVFRKSAVLVGGRIDERTEFKILSPGQFQPVETVEFHVQEGRQPCIDFVVERMSSYLAGQLRSPKDKVEGQPPPTIGNWKLLGRFRTADKAQEALKKAEAVYLAQPRWEASND